MVSQSSSVGNTIMGKTADLTVVQRRPLTPCTRRARHKRSLQKRLDVHRALCPSTLIERRGRKDVVEKSVQAIGITAPWRGLWNKPIQKCGGDSQKWTAAGVSAQEPLRTDVCKTWVSAVAFLVSSHSWTTDSVRSISPGAKDKKDCTAAEWSKVMFSDESKFCISFGIRVPESGGREERPRNPRCWGPSVKFPQSVMVWGAMSSAGVVHCVFWGPRSTQPYTRKF